VLDAWRSWPGRQRLRFVFNGAVALLALFILYQARGALTPFIVGLVGAYLLVPGVNWVQRHLPRRLSARPAGRALAILLVYLVVLGLVVGFFALIVPVIVRQIEQLIANRERIVATILTWAADLRAWYFETFPEALRSAIEGQLRALGDQIVRALQQGIVGGIVVVRNVLALILGYLVVPVWLFFFLLYSRHYRSGLVDLIPESARPDVFSILRIADDVLGAYIRGQLVVAGIAGMLSTIVLSLLGVDFAILLGVLVFFGDLIPTVGPILAAIPTVIIAALERPILGLWALLGLMAVQQFESMLVGPRVVGTVVRLTPAVIIVLLVIGGQLWGFIGLLLVVPLFALTRDLVRYVNWRTTPEPHPPEDALRRVREQRQRRAI
jgi:predicted PurR-regulated permease PerM